MELEFFLGGGDYLEWKGRKLAQVWPRCVVTTTTVVLLELRASSNVGLLSGPDGSHARTRTQSRSMHDGRVSTILCKERNTGPSRELSADGNHVHPVFIVYAHAGTTAVGR